MITPSALADLFGDRLDSGREAFTLLHVGVVQRDIADGGSASMVTPCGASQQGAGHHGVVGAFAQATEQSDDFQGLV